jgi:hypothetical protein
MDQRIRRVLRGDNSVNGTIVLWWISWPRGDVTARSSMLQLDREDMERVKHLPS